ncbi:hypothetical protein, partial [Pectobacterium parmentieri]|uniref:hypothetical protein n=1 Tax=Pectobacterium parmentieri TaxID=1905730 RepID=UPI003019A83A
VHKLSPYLPLTYQYNTFKLVIPLVNSALRKTFSITAHSAQLLAHFLVEITVCAMDAVFSRGLRNFLLKFGLRKI